MFPTNESGPGAAATAHEAIETHSQQGRTSTVNDTPKPVMIEAADKIDARADEQEAGGLPASIVEISRKVTASLRTITSEDLTADQYVACRTGALLLAEQGCAELADDVQLAADMHHYAAVTAEGGDCGCPACRNAQEAIDEGRDDEPAISLGELAGRTVFVGDSVGTDFPAKIVLDEQVVMELPNWVIVYVDQPRWNKGEPGNRVFLDVGGAEAELTHTEGVRVCNALVAALNEVGESR